MHKSKITSILRTLSRAEIEKFSAYLNTPLFNERKKISLFFEEIRKFHPEYENPKYSKENLFKKLYGNKKYNDTLMRNLISRLYNKLESFLSFLNYKNNTFEQEYGLLTEFSIRGHEDLFKKKVASILKSIHEKKPAEKERYYREHKLVSLQSSFYDNSRHTPDTAKYIFLLREKKITEYFLAETLFLYSTIANHLTLYPDKTLKFKLLDLITNYIRENNEILQNNFYINILYCSLMLSLTQKNIYYFELKKIISENKETLPRFEKSRLYTVLHNYLQEKMFTGEKGALIERFELFKETFENEGAYDNDRNIHHTVLILAVSNALMLKEYSAALEYVAKYANEVRDYYKKSTKSYCLALIDYYMKNYAGALKNLKEVYSEDISFKIHVRTLMLMIYFSMSQTEGFNSLADSYKHFLNEALQNKKTSEYFYNIYMNFIHYSSELFKIKENKNNFDLIRFKKELTEKQNVAKKQWLIEMAEEIGRK